MACAEGGDGGRVEDARGGPVGRRARRTSRARPQPAPERHREAHLRSVDRLAPGSQGRTARRRSAFASVPVERSARGIAAREREDVAVEEHRAHLEGDGHAGAVDLRQDPRAERRLQVEVAHRVDEPDVLRRRRGEMRAHGVERVVPRERVGERASRGSAELLRLPARRERREQELLGRLLVAEQPRPEARRLGQHAPRRCCDAGRDRPCDAALDRARRASSAYFG